MLAAVAEMERDLLVKALRRDYHEQKPKVRNWQTS